jgi:hypothetical protein
MLRGLLRFVGRDEDELTGRIRALGGSGVELS